MVDFSQCVLMETLEIETMDGERVTGQFVGLQKEFGQRMLAYDGELCVNLFRVIPSIGYSCVESIAISGIKTVTRHGH